MLVKDRRRRRQRRLDVSGEPHGPVVDYWAILSEHVGHCCSSRLRMTICSFWPLRSSSSSSSSRQPKRIHGTNDQKHADRGRPVIDMTPRAQPRPFSIR
jgi:hypothetical protein